MEVFGFSSKEKQTILTYPLSKVRNVLKPSMTTNESQAQEENTEDAEADVAAVVKSEEENAAQPDDANDANENEADCATESDCNDANNTQESCDDTVDSSVAKSGKRSQAQPTVRIRTVFSRMLRCHEFLYLHSLSSWKHGDSDVACTRRKWSERARCWRSATWMR